ncbi:MAG: putative Ig domain-containing protein [Acidobacteriia bacterium]|nr:putative Ig domain-containing protein [Terriglobia bacterium]
MPAGVTLSNASGSLSGTPSAAGTYNITMRVADANGQQASKIFSLVILLCSGCSGPLGITTTSLPNGTVGAAYGSTLGAIGGTPPYTWSISSGQLPSGLSLISLGVISGTPTTAGSYSVALQAADSAGNRVSQSYMVTVVDSGGESLMITTADLPNGTSGAIYSVAMSASGGTPPYIWSVSSGQLPPEVSIGTATGLISGTPTQGGLYTPTVTATDAGGNPVSKTFTLEILDLDQYGGLMNLSCTNGPQGQFYTQKMGTRWYLCTPDGHAFFFRAVSHIDYNSVITDGGYSYQSVIQNKFAGDPQAWQYGWADTTLARIKSWGFNAVGDSSSTYVWPWGSGGSRTPATKLPVIPSTAMSYYSFTNNGNFGPAPTKSLMDCLSGSAYTGYVGRGLPDVYDPNYDAYVNGRHAGTLADAYWSKTFTSPWSLGFVVDESDDVFGLNGPGPEAPNPPDGGYHPHVGWIALAVSPTKANSSRWGVTYSNTTVYSKLELRKFLDGATYTGKYATIAALNAAWGSNYTTFGSAGGWPKATTGGTGLMDEDGSSPWLGDTAAMLYNATSGVTADLDTFLLQWSRKYFSLHRTRFKQYSPNQLMFCPMLNNHGGLTRRQVLQAAGEYCDVIQAGADNQALLDKTALYAGDRPIMHGFVGTPANPDSALWRYANLAGSPATTQEQRGAYYNTAATALWSNAVTATGAKPVIGFTFWEWSDNWNDNGSKINWGLVTARDNAYDGRQAISAAGTDSWGYPTGGEERDFGNFIDSVRNANLAIWQALAAGQ